VVRQAQKLVKAYLEDCGGANNGFVYGPEERRLALNIANALLEHEKAVTGEKPDPDADFFVPIRVPQKVGVVLEVADADVEYVRKNLHAALGIPDEYKESE
jgi:hypothetical protein